jgi:hypothetical protein
VPALRSAEDDFSAADYDESDYSDPSDTVAVVATTQNAESTMSDTAAATVGGDEAAPRSPRGLSSSATKTSAPVPGRTIPETH